jgi:hypothetical protein
VAVVVGVDVDVPVWPGDAFVAAVLVGSFSKPDDTVNVLYFKLNEDIEVAVDHAEEVAFMPLEIHVLVEK